MNLPDKFETFDEAKKAGFLELKEQKEKGKKVVGIFCSYTPIELIMAAGACSVSLCGSGEESIPAAETRLPKNLCPLIKASYGVALTDNCPYFYFSDVILAETTCDGKKKMYELLNELKPVHVMHLPQMQNDACSLDLWTAEMHRTKDFLEQHLDVTITDENLRKAIRERNRIRCSLLKLYETARMIPSPVSGYELSTIAETADFHFADDDLAELLDQKAEEYRARYQSQDPSKPVRPRILVTGCPIGGAREKVLQKVEELGADVVAFDSCSGPRTQRESVDETKDPYTALAEKYLKINCSVMTPNSSRFKELGNMIDDYQIDGVIEVVLHACHTFAVEAYYTRQYVTETKKIPYIYIDTDFSTADTGQIATRLGAFLEILET